MEEAIRKAQVLIEALPYIKKFHKKIVVIKYGGSILGDEKIRKAVLEDIVFLNFTGLKAVLVHGGGPHISERMRSSGKKTDFVDGMRVTDESTLKIVEEELESLNSQIVRELQLSFSHYRQISHGETVDKIVLSGGASRLKNIQSVLSEILNLEVVDIESLISLGKDEALEKDMLSEQSGSLAIAIGAALEEGTNPNLLFDISRAVKKNYLVEYKDSIRAAAIVVVTALLVIVVLSVSRMYYRSRIHFYKASLSKSEKENHEYFIIKKDVKRLEAKKALLADVSEPRFPLVDILAQLSTIIDPRKIFVGDMSFVRIGNNQMELKMHGEALNNEQASLAETLTKFVSELKMIQYLTDITPLIRESSGSDSERGRLVFDISCRVAKITE